MLVKNPSKRDQKLAILLAVIILIIGFIIFKSYPSIIKNLIEQRAGLINENETLKEKDVLLKNLQENFKKFQELEGTEKISMLLPQEPDIPNLLVNLEALAREKGVILSAVNIEPAKTFEQGVESVEFKAEFSGKIDYAMLKSIIRAIENNLRIFEIINFNFKPEQSSLLLHLKTFFLAADQSLTPTQASDFPKAILKNQNFIDLKGFGKTLVFPEQLGNPNPLPAPVKQ